jgi:regulator of protease activity HflC (stomatin/prohibitin superfamily)
VAHGEYRDGMPSWLSARGVGRAITWTALGVLAAIPLLGGWFTVDAGERAVVLRFGAIQGVYAEGFHLKIPMIDKLVRIDVRIAKHPTKSEASSKDLQIVHTEIMLNYHPDAAAVASLYQNIGLEWESRIIDPAVNETFKAVTARYTAEQLVTKREEVSHAINASLRDKLTPYGLVVEPNGVNITDFDFSPEFNRAIEEKVTAEQRALKAQRDLERIHTEAEQRVTAAEGEARALRAQRMEVTPELIRLREVENQRLALEKWNGQLPQYVGSGPIPFIDLSPRR